MDITSHKRRWRRALSSIRTELFLAQRNYGVTLSKKRHADIIAGNRAKVAVLRKMLKELQAL